jgi:hypothetical protein
MDGWDIQFELYRIPATEFATIEKRRMKAKD